MSPVTRPWDLERCDVRDDDIDGDDDDEMCDCCTACSSAVNEASVEEQVLDELISDH